MKRQLTLVGGIAASVLLGVSGAFAQPFGPPEDGSGRGRFGGPDRFLELTDEQQALARGIFEQQRPQMEALHKQMRENRRRLQESLESSNPDPATVGELVIEGHRLREEGRTLREDSKKAFEGLLSPDQKRKLEMLEAARAASGPRGPGRMMPGEGEGPGRH